MKNSHNIYLVAIMLTLSACATPRQLTTIKSEPETPFAENSPLAVSNPSDLPNDVCWFEGSAYEKNALICQYRYGVEAIQSEKHPFQCKRDAGRSYWEIIGTKTC